MKTYKTKRKVIRILVSVLFSLVIVCVGAVGSLYYLNIRHQQQIETAKIVAQKALADKLAVIEAKKKEPVYITLPGAKQIRAIVDDYSKTDSIWHLVSKTSPIAIDYVPANLKIPDVATRTDKSADERSVRTDIETPMIEMFAAATASGYNLMIGSGYRSAALQEIYLNNYAASAGIAAANQYVAKPGQSEHQTGLAADITTVSRNCYLTECFADTPDGQWLADNSYKYGFILRYPKDKEDITGYQYEPWHFRYVGIDMATAIHDSGLTFDEAWVYIDNALTTLRDNGAI